MEVATRVLDAPTETNVESQEVRRVSTENVGTRTGLGVHNLTALPRQKVGNLGDSGALKIDA